MRYGITALILIVILAFHQYTKPSVNTLITTYTAKPTDDVIFNIPIYIYTDEFVFPDLIQATDIQLKSELAKIQANEFVNFKYDLKFGKPGMILKNDGDGDANNNTKDVDDKFDENAHLIEFTLHDIEALYNMPNERKSEFMFRESTVFSNDFPYFLTQTIIHQLFRDELQRFQLDKFTRDEYGVKFTEENNIGNGTSISLNFKVFEGVDYELLQNSFNDLGSLIDLKFNNSDEEEKGDHVININIEKGNKSEQITFDNSITIVLQNDEDWNYPQLIFDIKDQLCKKLNLIEHPQIIPLKIDMELRYQIVHNLLQFIRNVNLNRSILHDDDIVKLFQLRSEILKIIRERYDWQRAFLMSKELVLRASQ